MTTTPRSPLVDPFVGLVRPPVLSEIGRGEPKVFIAATQTGDLGAYGLEWAGEIAGSGAALSREEAEWAAVGECVERYALAAVEPERVVLASHAELSTKQIASVGPGEWALFDPSQDGETPFALFEDETRIAWIQGESLTQGGARLVPACFIWLPYYGVSPDEEIVAPTVSTGAACATSVVAAEVRGICELIERDAFMIVWRNQLACPRVEIDEGSQLAPVFAECFARPGLDYRLWLTTLDLRVHSFFGVLRDTRDGGVRTIVGGAAGLDPLWAARKTLLELVQGLAWVDYITRGAPFVYEQGFGNVTSFEDRVQLYGSNDLSSAFSFLDADGRPPVPLSSLPSLEANSLEDDLDLCVGILAERSLETIVVDLTPVDVAACGLRAVRVLVPGLETMDGDHRLQFLGGYRWRSVPVELGLRQERCSLDEMNPYPHPYP